MSKPERLLFRVARHGDAGVLLPNDGYTAKRLRERGYKVGDILLTELRKPRHPGFHRFAHRMGVVLANNIDAFAGLDGHEVLKRIQIEGNIACDEIPVVIPVIGEFKYRVPRSLSFASMDEAEFKDTIRAMSRYVAERYWPSLTPEAIEEMAMAMPDAA